MSLVEKAQAAADKLRQRFADLTEKLGLVETNVSEKVQEEADRMIKSVDDAHSTTRTAVTEQGDRVLDAIPSDLETTLSDLHTKVDELTATVDAYISDDSTTE